MWRVAHIGNITVSKFAVQTSLSLQPSRAVCRPATVTATAHHSELIGELQMFSTRRSCSVHLGVRSHLVGSNKTKQGTYVPTSWTESKIFPLSISNFESLTKPTHRATLPSTPKAAQLSQVRQEKKNIRESIFSTTAQRSARLTPRRTSFSRLDFETPVEGSGSKSKRDSIEMFRGKSYLHTWCR